MRLLLLADIHIGSIKDTEYIYNTLTEIFDNELKFKKTDAVIILGDYFHKLFKVNDTFVSLSINVMSYLVRLCKQSKTKIRIIYGTESHEMRQYKLFNYHINSRSVDMKIIDSVQSEMLFKDTEVLYIPEEYVDSKSEYYKKAFSKKYKYIFGHGIISEGMPAIVSLSHSETNKHVPKFKSKELANISDVCVFGHYHTYTDIGDNVFYLGSLYRDSFGEEEAKGYGIIEDDKLLFVENEKAYTYKTYTYDANSSVYDNANDMLDELNKIRSDHRKLYDSESFNGKIRIIFNPPTSDNEVFKETMKTIVSVDSLIQTMVKEPEIIDELTTDDVSDEYSFIIDPSMDIIDKIQLYMKKYHNYDLATKDLKKYINDPFVI